MGTECYESDFLVSHSSILEELQARGITQKEPGQTRRACPEALEGSAPTFYVTMICITHQRGR